jgi:ParB family chromosome partitioning protein
LLGLPTAEAQTAALQTILKRQLSVRQTEELVRRLLGQKPPRVSRPIDEEISEVQERLRERLGTKVELKHTKKGGRIVIHYYSNEELQALLEQMTGE